MTALPAAFPHRLFAAEHLQHIPKKMRQEARWVCWRPEWRDGKWTKIPLHPQALHRASSTDSATWGSLEDATTACRRNTSIGIGFMLGAGFSGLDIDKCVDSAGIKPEARSLLDRLDTYREYSVSGTGVHAIFRGELPPGRRRGSFKGLAVELYDSARFFVVTGDPVGDAKDVEERTAAAAAIHTDFFGDAKGAVTEIRSAFHGRAVSIPDSDLLDRMFAAANGAKIRRLWAGDTSDFENDSSAADMALCIHLAFWTGRDAARMDALFRQSGLMREKWNSARGTTTYGALTIERARAETAEVYTPRAGRQFGETRQIPPKKPPSEPPNDDPSPDFALTDLGNSERLVRDLRGAARYCQPLDTWLLYDGMRYCPDESSAIERCVKKSVRAIPLEAATLGRRAAELRKRAADESMQADEQRALFDTAAKTDKTAARLCTWALKSESSRALTAAVALARSHEDVIVSPAELDADPWLLNVTNGVLDMRTAKLFEHSPDRLITKLAPVMYDPEAICPRWLEYLDAVFPGSYTDTIPFLQKAIGYSLTGITSEECFFVLVGAGRNGKGTLIKIISALLGSYACQADFSSFIQRKDDSAPREDIAAMRGAYFVAAQESRERATFAEALIKNLTGGDTIRARRLHENGFEFTPRFKIWLATNHKPVIQGTDLGIWSRVRLIPFTESFEGREDKTLKDLLLTELSGILNWAIEGCLEWQRAGLGLSESVAAANASYRKECDQLQTFLDDRCQRGEYFSVGAHQLYLAYKKWAGECGEDFVTETAFGLRMTEKGHQKERKTSGVRYSRLGLTLHSSNSEITLHAE